MSNKNSINKLKIKKVIEKEIKNIPPPFPPTYKYIASYSINESTPFSYELLIKYLSECERTRHKSVKKVVTYLFYLLLISSIMIVTLLGLSIFYVQFTLNEIQVIPLNNETIRVVWKESKGEFNWLTNLIINNLMEVSIKVIPDNITKTLKYNNEIDFKINIGGKYFILNVKARVLSIIIFEREKILYRT